MELEDLLVRQDLTEFQCRANSFLLPMAGKDDILTDTVMVCAQTQNDFP